MKNFLLFCCAWVGVSHLGALVVSGAEASFKITRTKYDRTANQVELEFNSRIDANYSVETSLDLKVWSPGGADVLSGGVTTRFKVLNLPAESMSYFRVQEHSAPTNVDSEPIVAMGHGGFIGGDNRQFLPTVASIIRVQQYYIAQLINQVAGSKEMQLLINGLVKDTILANAFFMDYLIEKNQPDNRGHLGSINSGLRLHYVNYIQTDSIRPMPGQSWAKGVPTDVASKLVENGVGGFQDAPAGIEAYIKECRECGVPIPPPLFSPGWTSLGVVDLPFLAESMQAELWIHEAPNGVCLALPRYVINDGKVTDDINGFGIICLGTDTSKACFFDNPPSIVFKRNVATAITNFIGGGDLYEKLGGICTDCHAGENPFVIHPQRAAFKTITANLMPKQWHKPIVDKRWPQNPGPIALLEKVESAESCLECHRTGDAGRFPDPLALKGYSQTVLGIAAGRSGKRTMPPAGDGVGDRNPYTNHIATLMSAYLRPIIIACADPDGSVTNGTISPDGTFTKGRGESQAFTATPNPGFEVVEWRVDGKNVQDGGMEYTLTNIQGSHTVQVIFGPPADLEVTMPVPPTAFGGNTVTIELLVRNLGPGPARNVMLIHSLADPNGNSFGVDIQSANLIQGSCLSSFGTTTCHLRDLSGPFGVTISMVATIPPGVYFTRASVTSSGTDPNPNNNIVFNFFRVGVP